MNFEKAVEYIQGVEKFGSNLALERIDSLLDAVGRPDESLNVVHIAGTNGKGSVSALLSSVLTQQGYRVGVFNSPSVFCYNERFILLGEYASDEKIAKALSRVIGIREQMKRANQDLPTAFELEFAAALLLFKEHKCDIVILETGLGGRADATNAVRKKLLAIVVQIAFDHTDILGNTLYEIAREKAAIVKDCPLITLPQDDEIMRAFREVTSNIVLTKDAQLLKIDCNGQQFLYSGEKYTSALIGTYQLKNCALVIEAVALLKDLGFSVSDRALKQGIKKAKIKGRFEVAQITDREKKRYFVFDGAHNASSAQALKDTLRLCFDGCKKVLIIGVFEDKDYTEIARVLSSEFSLVFVVEPPSKRALSAKKLEECFLRCYSGELKRVGSVKKAIKEAYDTKIEVVCIAGSFSILQKAQQSFFELIVSDKDL